MATRGTIALEYADSTVQQIYVHWDSYLDGVGQELVDDYSDPFALDRLIAQGDTSTIGEPYTRRGEELNIRYYKDFDDYVLNGQREEYDYILRRVNEQAVWFVRCYDTNNQWITFDQAMRQRESSDDCE